MIGSRWLSEELRCELSLNHRRHKSKTMATIIVGRVRIFADNSLVSCKDDLYLSQVETRALKLSNPHG